MRVLWIVACFFGAVSGAEITTLLTKIVEGVPVDIKDAPWAVSMHKVFENGTSDFFCGGSIIGPNEVLTAAHCLNNVKNSTFFFRAGSIMEKSGGTAHYSDWYRISPLYSQENDYDFAFVRVKERFDYNDYVRRIKIPTEDPESGSVVSVFGWGRIDPSMSITSQILRGVNITMWDKKDCLSRFKVDLDLAMSKPAASFCLKNIGDDISKSTCKGDSGGGIVYKNQLVGVLSGAIRPTKSPKTAEDVDFACNERNVIQLYNSPVKVKDWLQKLIDESQGSHTPLQNVE